ncbi:RNA-directed DNA polymerase from mobile element jockey [Anthophora retusa]
MQEAISKIFPSWVPERGYTVPPDINEPFLDDRFSALEFNHAIKEIKDKAAPGPDCIDNMMIKHLSNRIRLLLLDIFNELYTKHVVPTEWKNVHVLFIPKTDRKGFRPITLSSCLCKLFERLVKNRLNWWCEHHDIIHPTQSEFRRGRSCIDNVGSVILQAEESLMTGRCTITAFLDIKGAFDDVLPNS